MRTNPPSEGLHAPKGLGKSNATVMESSRGEKMSDITNDAYNVTAEELRQFIERFEHLEAEKKDIADQQKEVMAEAKGRGYDTKVLRKIIALRKRTPDDIAEEEAVLDLYKAALGME
ncbi:uncharacterized protein (UPF0335 family) [Roseinatronobacter thiooxidans]|uniref:Uncharacterized protein (UPF0335 family) n=2 Tax=Roseinatronobacter thiooxidans TaxID=121821 RepID=A0A2W7RVK5_9RHOB|nr:uncharacterized protein (UPF0335 family) [Roseinatronobacter thiooxidans]